MCRKARAERGSEQTFLRRRRILHDLLANIALTFMHESPIFLLVL